nr:MULTISPECIES: EF-hand domain-containing protein [unclassified Acidovorax]
MRKRISLAACLMGAVLATMGSAALAQAPAAPPPEPAASAPAEPGTGQTKGEIKAMRDFKMLDFNGDGKLSRTEVKLFPRLAAAFDEADTDGDGYVSYEEVRVFAARYRAERDRNKAAQAARQPASGSQP